MAAGFLIGVVGFGFGLVTSPVLLLFLDPQTVVVTINAVAIVAFGLLFIETRHHVRYRELTPTAAAGALGVPFGVHALDALNPAVLRTGICALVLVLTVVVMVKTEWLIPKPRISGPILGFGVAAMVTGLSIGGPLFVLFLIGLGMERRGVQAGMAFFFTVMYCTAAIGYFVQGLFTVERLVLIAAVTPGVVFGYWLSVRFAGRMNERTFRHLVVVVIVVTSVMVLAREMSALLVD